ncbi:MAG: sigma-70 family RNA polymerase sigma factor [Bacteroidota bacterium]
MKDQELLLLLKSGVGKKRNKALELIYDRVFPLFSNYVIKNNGSNEIAMDLFQDGVVIFFEKVKSDRFEGNSTISTYLFGICKNLWFQYLKSQMRLSKISPMYDEIIEDLSEEDKENAFFGRVLEQLMEKLDANCRQIIRLYYFEEKSIREIKKIYKLGSDQAAKTKKYRCMLKLISLFKKYDVTKEKLLNN